MDGIESFLNAYGLAAIFGLMLVKAVGVPIPIPADVVMLAASARVAVGKLDVWQAFAAILVALVVGGVIQFLLARGPGRGFLYRFGRTLGLTPARLDAVARTVEKGGPIGIGLAVLTPGIRAAAVAACGLAALPLRVFVPGLTLGSGLFLALHFFLGALIAPLVAGLSQSGLLVIVLALAIAGMGAWVVIRRRQRPDAPANEVIAEALEAWHEATCPVCLALGAALPTASVQPATAGRG